MKNNINIREWKEFYLNKIFKFEKGKCNNAGQLLENGDELYYIGAKKTDNGVMYKVKNEENLKSCGNCLIFIADGEGSVGFHLYQDVDFIGSTTLKIARNKNLNKYNALFLVSVLDKERFRYSFGRKYKINNETKIKLPSKLNSKNEYEPDWEYMESYTRKLYEKVIRESYTRNTKPCLKFNIYDWKSYKIDKLFNIYTGGDLILNEVEEGEIPIVSHSENNCGVNYYCKKIQNRKIFNHNNCLSLADRGLFKTFTQQKDFYIGTRVKALELKNKGNKYILLFISTIINNEIWRFNYGRNSTDKLPKLVIKLPSRLNSKNEYEPDWEYMENYVKSLPYGDVI